METKKIKAITLVNAKIIDGPKTNLRSSFNEFYQDSQFVGIPYHKAIVKL